LYPFLELLTTHVPSKGSADQQLVTSKILSMVLLYSWYSNTSH